MDDNEFDRALIASAFDIAAERGWERVTVAGAALRAGLPLDRARGRFPGRPAILLRFGRIADMAALTDPAATPEAPGEAVRDQIFGMLMRRIDVFQSHREGLQALFRWLPAKPMAGLLLMDATRRSMAWLLEAAGVPTSGLRGTLRVKGLVAVWLYTLRAWRRDRSGDLSATMAALDEALRRAERAEEMVPCGTRRQRVPDAEPESPAADAGTEPTSPPDIPPPAPPPIKDPPFDPPA